MSISFYALSGQPGTPEFGATANFHTPGGALMLSLLGYPVSPDGDIYGEASPEEFTARLALACARHAGAAHLVATGARLLPEGAYRVRRWADEDAGRRLDELEQVAADATARGGQVCWA